MGPLVSSERLANDQSAIEAKQPCGRIGTLQAGVTDDLRCDHAVSDAVPPVAEGKVAAGLRRRFADAGEAGHINAESGLGDWRFGQLLLERLIHRQNDAAERNRPLGVVPSGEVPRLAHGRGLRL